MENLEKGKLPEKNAENTIFKTKDAVASITVNFEKKCVWLNNLQSAVKGQGFGSKLLDELKKKYPDYTIIGQASPTEFDRPEKPSDQEMEKAVDLGWSPASKRDKEEFQNSGLGLTADEMSFIRDVAERFHIWKKNEPSSRLFNFYRKNGFTLSQSGSGFFESNPPHKLSGEVVTAES